MLELMIVIGIIVVLSSLLLVALTRAQKAHRHEEASATLARLTTGLGTLLMEKPLPTTPERGNDGSGYLKAGQITVSGVDYDTVLEQLRFRELFSFKPAHLDDADRLLDPWQQPYLFVIGSNTDPNGHSPSILHASTFTDWSVVNADAPVDSRIYIYSYGPNNPAGSDIDATQWMYHAHD